MFRKTAPYLLLLVLATGAGYATAELMPDPGTQHTAPDTPAAPTPDRSGEPIARPAVPVAATGAPSSASEPQLGAPAPAVAPSDAEGTDAGLITQPAPQLPLPGGAATPDPADPPIADETGYGPACPTGQELQGDSGCVQPQLPEETNGRQIDCPDGTTVGVVAGGQVYGCSCSG